MSRRFKYSIPLALGLLVVCLLLAHEFAFLGGAPAPVPRAQKELTNSIGMKFVRIPAGKFFMGSPKEEKYHHDSEEPYHEVEISKSFFLGVYEVTQIQYKKVMGNNPSFCSATGPGKKEVKGLNTDDFPVEMVSWDDAKRFCTRLAALREENKAGRSYRLPTEAEWEYACRAGTKTAFHYGKRLSWKQANFVDWAHKPDETGQLGRSATVGSYKPNAFGLYDMHGNIAEWCEDRCKRLYYKEAPKKDPLGPTEKDAGREELRSYRSGSYDDPIWLCRAASRNGADPKKENPLIGVRLVCLAP